MGNQGLGGNDFGALQAREGDEGMRAFGRSSKYVRAARWPCYPPACFVPTCFSSTVFFSAFPGV